MIEEDPTLAPRKTAAAAAPEAAPDLAPKPRRVPKPKAVAESVVAPAAKPRTRKAAAAPAEAAAVPVKAKAKAKATPRPRAKKAAAPPQRALLDLVVKTIDDNKGEDIVAIDLAGKSSIADFMVVASGRSARQVGALSGYVVEAVEKAGFGPCRTEGKRAGDWVLIDAGDVIVHLFRPEVRAFYNLEKMWQADFRGDSGAATAE